MQNQWSFRPGTQDDVDELVKIDKKTYPEPWTAKHFQAELEKPYSHVLLLTDDETDTKIAAYAVYWLLFERCDLLNIVVDLTYRGLGFGKKTIQQITRHASQKGIKQIHLEVRKSNAAAIYLYQHCHFSITQVRKNFYSNGEDAYHMVLDLKDQEITMEVV